MTTIATKNGAIIVKEGSIGTDCACCGGWYCVQQCCTMPIVTLTISSVEQEFQPWYNFNRSYQLTNQDPVFPATAFIRQSWSDVEDRCIRSGGFFPNASTTYGNGVNANACDFHAFSAGVWRAGIDDGVYRRPLVMLFSGVYEGQCERHFVGIDEQNVWGRLAAGEILSGSYSQQINIGLYDHRESLISFSWTLEA